MAQMMGLAVLAIGLLFTSINLGPQGRRLDTEATIRAHEGTPLSTGDRCDVVVEPVRRIGGFNCRVTVTCDGHTYYGGEQLGGFLRCDAVAGRYLGGVDTDPLDGDPAIDLDLRRGRIQIEARFPEPHRLELDLAQ